jgi:hypothetical protein
MARIEIRDYGGDFEDIAELTHRVWVPEYGGKIWVVVPHPAWVRWRFAPEAGGLCLVAYEGTKLVGSIASISQSLRIGSSVHSIALFTGFSVDANHRGVALPLIARLRRKNEERGIAFATGMVIDDPRSASYRFWTKYAETFPQNFPFLFGGGYWAKFLAPRILTRASIEAWERVASRTLGPLLRMSPFGYDPQVRPYRAADLERCAQMLDKASAHFGWAQVWSQERLSYHLDNPETKAFVFERDGRVHGMVSHNCSTLHGREPICAAMISLWADDDLSGTECVRLLAHLCTYLRENDVHAVVAVRSSMIPTAALVANLFVPGSQRFRIGIFPTRHAIQLSPPKTWNLEIT